MKSQLTLDEFRNSWREAGGLDAVRDIETGDSHRSAFVHMYAEDMKSKLPDIRNKLLHDSGVEVPNAKVFGVAEQMASKIMEMSGLFTPSPVELAVWEERTIHREYGYYCDSLSVQKPKQLLAERITRHFFTPLIHRRSLAGSEIFHDLPDPAVIPVDCAPLFYRWTESPSDCAACVREWKFARKVYPVLVQEVRKRGGRGNKEKHGTERSILNVYQSVLKTLSQHEDYSRISCWSVYSDGPDPVSESTFQRFMKGVRV
jgi:hypothetical protein